jgi:hypothetical protein
MPEPEAPESGGLSAGFFPVSEPAILLHPVVNTRKKTVKTANRKKGFFLHMIFRTFPILILLKK